MSDNYEKISNNPKAMEILENCAKQGLSDKKIVDRLFQEIGYKWSLETVRRQRRRIGINRQNGIDQQTLVVNKPSLSVPLPGLNEEEKAHWFRDQFKKSHLYTALKLQFNEEEIYMYLEEYGSLCCQFEDIVFSEFFQIDDFLKHRILIHRQLVTIKNLEGEIKELSYWINQHPNKEDLPKEDKLFRLEQYRLLESKRSDLNKSNDRYDKLVAERQKIYSGLAATRKDRVDELRGGRESFFNLVTLLQTSEQERNKQGKFAALTKIAADDVINHFRNPIEFPDGSKEPAIIDADTEEI